MRYRKLDANGDMTFGQGSASFWVDVPDAPAQAVGTRLRLRLGEWFLNITDGTDWAGKVLGNRTEQTRDLVIQDRILGTQGVVQIVEYGAYLNRDTRAWQVTATIDTVYGRAQIEEAG